ncbi:MAG: BLUF domain-containing protein [Pseudomonadota bacterium]
MTLSAERNMSMAATPEANEEELFRLAYASTQTKPMGASDLIGMLNQARANNLRENITGVLLHRDDSFMQVIEGDKQAVLDLFNLIQDDPRHKKIELLAQGVAQEREFSDWQMGFLELDEVDVTLLPGFSNFLNENDSPRTMLKLLSQSERLMLLFKVLG